MSLFSPPAAPSINLPPLPAAPTPPPAFGMIQGQKPGTKSSQATFLGSDAVPGPGPGSMQFGGKTLLGT